VAGGRHHRQRNVVATARVRDAVSGMGVIQLTTSPRVRGNLVNYGPTARLTVAATVHRIYLRMRDRADNYSRWKTIRT